MNRYPFCPTPPTSTLPPLARLQDRTPPQVLEALQNLRSLYWPPPLLPPNLLLPKRGRRGRLTKEQSVPDSGYASAEDEEQLQDTVDEPVVDHFTNDGNSDESLVDRSHNTATDLKMLRSDTFERAFSIKWITGFISRSDSWIGLSLDEEESGARAYIVDYAAAILSDFAGDATVEAVTRHFSFPLQSKDGSSPTAIKVELNDEPLSTEDHTSVGLQSWASSILLAERVCTTPARFGLGTDTGTRLRVLELGAGTGLLSIVTSKILQHLGHTCFTVVATDYHPDVLGNLSVNVRTNFTTSSPPFVTVHLLDWADPRHSAPLGEDFDTILAADVIYHPEHARLIRGCVERFLARPHMGKGGGVFWLIMPIRSTGRHEGMDDTVESVFQSNYSDEVPVTEDWTLAILEKEEVVRHGSVGRVDESGYKLFKIGWVSAGTSMTRIPVAVHTSAKLGVISGCRDE